MISTVSTFNSGESLSSTPYQYTSFLLHATCYSHSAKQGDKLVQKKGKGTSRRHRLLFICEGAAATSSHCSVTVGRRKTDGAAHRHAPSSPPCLPHSGSQSQRRGGREDQLVQVAGRRHHLPLLPLCGTRLWRHRQWLLAAELLPPSTRCAGKRTWSSLPQVLV